MAEHKFIRRYASQRLQIARSIDVIIVANCIDTDCLESLKYELDNYLSSEQSEVIKRAMHLPGGFSVCRTMDGFRIKVNYILDVNDPGFDSAGMGAGNQWQFEVAKFFVDFASAKEAAHKYTSFHIISIAFIDDQNNYFSYDFK